MKNDVLNIAHRGASAFLPDNTIESFDRALAEKADMIEFDVRKTADGKLVLFHDWFIRSININFDVGRYTQNTSNSVGFNVTRLVSHTRFKELLDFCTKKGFRLATLDEVLEGFGHRIGINIELKGSMTGEAVVLLIEEYIKNNNWNYNQIIISSFNYEELKKVKSLQPSIKLGILVADSLTTSLQFAEELGAYSIHIDRESINKQFIDDAHQRQLKVFVYTVNCTEDIKRMQDLKVDGVFTDYPELVLIN